MDIEKLREKAFLHPRAVKALYAGWYDDMIAIEAQSPQDTYEADMKKLEAILDQASRENVNEPSVEARLKVRQAGRALDEREQTYHKQCEEEWAAFQQRLLQSCSRLCNSLNLLQALSREGTDYKLTEDLINDHASWKGTTNQVNSQPPQDFGPRVPSAPVLHPPAASADDATSRQITSVADVQQPPSSGRQTSDSNKRPSTRDLETPSKRFRTDRTVEFADIYQEGRNPSKDRIIRDPNSNEQSKYYILRCDEHNVVFNSKSPPRMATRHLRKFHGADVHAPTYGRAIQLFGYEVQGCTEELAQLNNRLIDQALEEEGARGANNTKHRKGQCRADVIVLGHHGRPASRIDYHSGNWTQQNAIPEAQVDWTRAGENGVGIQEEIAVGDSEPDDQFSDDEFAADDDANDHDWVDDQIDDQIEAQSSRTDFDAGVPAEPESHPTPANHPRPTLIVTLHYRRAPRQAESRETTNQQRLETVDTMEGIKREYAVFPVPDPAIDEGDDEDDEMEEGEIDEDMGEAGKGDDDDLQIIEPPAEVHAFEPLNDVVHVDTTTFGMDATEAQWPHLPEASSAAAPNGFADGPNTDFHTQYTFRPINSVSSQETSSSRPFQYQHILGLGDNPPATATRRDHAPMAAMGPD